MQKKKTKSGPTCIKCGVGFYVSCAEKAKRCCGFSLVLESAIETDISSNSELTSNNMVLFNLLVQELQQSNKLFQEKIFFVKTTLIANEEELKNK